MIQMQESIEFMDSNNSNPAFSRKWFELSEVINYVTSTAGPRVAVAATGWFRSHPHGSINISQNNDEPTASLQPRQFCNARNLQCRKHSNQIQVTAFVLSYHG
jgi:hypothetical protein